jgi:type II secretory pathway pseudopilin PulG
MTPKHRVERRAGRGLSAIEIVGTLGVLGLLSGLMTPFLNMQVDRSRAVHIARDFQQIEGAVRHFRRDTERLPIHYSGYDPSEHPDVQNLTVRPSQEAGIRGWNGPYVDAAWPRRNAWGGRLDLVCSTHQFDRDGDGQPDTHAANCYLYLTGVSEHGARELDRLIDRKRNSRAGRATYDRVPGGGATVYLLISD